MVYNIRIISEKTLKTFWEQHADAEGPLRTWRDHAKRAVWEKPADIERDYGSDVILPNNRAVFNIKGNHYRLVVAIHYKSHIVYIRFIGTHEEYNKIDATII